MKSILIHCYVLFFGLFLGAGIYILEEVGGSSAGLFSQHFLSTVFFLGLGIYALATTVVVVIVAIVKYRKKHEYSTASLAFTHIFTVAAVVIVAYITYPLVGWVNSMSAKKTEIGETRKVQLQIPQPQHQKVLPRMYKSTVTLPSSKQTTQAAPEEQKP